MKIVVEENLWLELLEEQHANALFNLLESNRNFLQDWMPSVNNIKTLQLMNEFIIGSIQRNSFGGEFAFVIKYENILVGRIGIYKIDSTNRVAEVGYWLAENFLGIGLMTKCCKKLTSYCFEDLLLNRIEIKCATENYKSQGVPLRLNFKLEGILQQAEFNGHKFYDLNLYAVLKRDWIE